MDEKVTDVPFVRLPPSSSSSILSSLGKSGVVLGFGSEEPGGGVTTPQNLNFQLLINILTSCLKEHAQDRCESDQPSAVHSPAWVSSPARSPALHRLTFQASQRQIRQQSL